MRKQPVPGAIYLIFRSESASRRSATLGPARSTPVCPQVLALPTLIACGGMGETCRGVHVSHALVVKTIDLASSGRRSRGGKLLEAVELFMSVYVRVGSEMNKTGAPRFTPPKHILRPFLSCSSCF